MDMNAKSPFVLASFLIGLLPVSHSIANEQTKDEVRQVLLSIQAELNEMENRKGEAPPSPKSPPAAIPEPVTQAELFPRLHQHPGPKPSLTCLLKQRLRKIPFPSFSPASKKWLVSFSPFKANWIN